MIGILVLIAIIIGVYFYSSWLEESVKGRTFETTIPPEKVQAIFEEKVATMGWKIVDDGNPMVAQSNIVTGIRQQIALKIEPNNNQTRGVVAPVRIVKKWFGAPTKAHTLRLRLNSFEKAIAASDSSASFRKQN